jgi:hypothetical protein
MPPMLGYYLSRSEVQWLTYQPLFYVPASTTGGIFEKRKPKTNECSYIVYGNSLPTLRKFLRTVTRVAIPGSPTLMLLRLHQILLWSLKNEALRNVMFS